MTLRLRPAALTAAAALVLTLSGCAAADKNAADTTSKAAVKSASSGAGSVMSSSAAMSSMNSPTAQKAMDAGAVTPPIPTQTIASGTWKQMKITAQIRTAVPFYIYTGSGYTEEKPTKQTSFHLMVMLNDKNTGVALPYATVWAQITKNGKTVFNERQWPMLSEYMGPHYGNNVTLPGPGTYHLRVLVSAPVAALHVEYAHMWVGTHTVNSTFTWK